MATRDPKSYLWQNICSMLRLESPSIDAVRAAIGVGRGTVQRIKEGGTSVGVDVLAVIARELRVQPWQLLIPDLDPDRLPRLDDEPPVRWPYKRVGLDVLSGLSGAKAAAVEAGMLAALAAAGIDPQKQQDAA